ncbi:MAG: S8 family serine peptidase [Candidatus Pacebacteria bacterium]|nr:S8 family serine peptidase [Candidatus Paceibacterota bacterium]
MKNLKPIFLFTAFLVVSFYLLTMGILDVKAVITQGQTSSNITEVKESKKEYIEGQIIVKFKEDILISKKAVQESYSGALIQTNKKSINQVLDKYKAKSFKRIFEKTKKVNLNKVVLIEVNSSDTLNIVKELQKDLNVEYAQPNYTYNTLFTPNDTLYSQQWAHQITKAEFGWDIEKGNINIVIAIIDTGVDWQHEDLINNIWTNGDEIQNNGVDDDNNGYIDDIMGWDFTNTSRQSYCIDDCLGEDNNPMDEYGHGTHCAGIAAGVSNNGKGIAGVCHNCRIMSLRAAGLADSEIANAIYYAADNGANVISMSFGGYDDSDTIRDAVDYAYSKNVVLVAAAGNDSYESVLYPACYDGVISVAATSSQDKRAWFSSFGYLTDVAAPGVDIISTMKDDSQIAIKNPFSKVANGYWKLSGTSMATPYVAGLAGLILSKKSNWTVNQVEMILKEGVDASNEDRYYIGAGRVNINKALEIDYLNTGKLSITSKPSDANVFVKHLDTGKFVYLGKTPLLTELLPGMRDLKVTKEDYLDKTTKVIITSEKTTTSNITLDLAPKLIFPLNNDVFRAGDIIQIRGTAPGPNFKNYKIEYENISYSVWSSEGITLIDGGTKPIIEGVLASWDTSKITTAGYYKIKLTLIKNDNTFFLKYIDYIHLDPTLKKGWPQYVNYDFYNQQFGSQVLTNSKFFTLISNNKNGINNSNSVNTIKVDESKNINLTDYYSTNYHWAGFLEPVAADINKDGYKEIIVAKGGKPEILVYNHKGDLLWKAVFGANNEYLTGLNIPIPLVGDIDNDGYDEIIEYNYTQRRLYVYNHDGSLLWSASMPSEELKPTMLMADLNLDGNKEIVFKGNDAKSEKMVIVNKNGNIISQWNLPPITFGAAIVSSPAVGNFDNDPELEIVSAGPSEKAGFDYSKNEWINEGIIYVYNLDGSIVSGWPRLVPGEIFSSPVVADIDNNGKEDIVVGLLYSSNVGYDPRYGGLYAFDRNGNILPGFPFRKGELFWSTPSLGDIDNDGDLEIAVNQLGYSTYLIHHDGTLLNGWPEYTGWDSYYSSIMGDINNDNLLDILTTTGTDVYAWNFNGTEVNGFPKYAEIWAEAPAVIADIDNDGKLELIASSDGDRDFVKSKLRNSIYVWELDGEYKSKNITWPSFMHDNQRTGRYTSNLVSHYKFENNTQDSSGSNHGTASGNPEYTEGKSGKAIKLDGIDDYVKIPYNPSLYSDTMTISFWAKSNKSDYAINSYPISMWDYATNKRMWAVYIPASTDKWSIFTSSDGGYKLVSTRSTNTAIDTNWHKYDIVVNNTNKTWDFYIDGSYLQRLTQYYSYTDKGSSLTIGGLIGSNYFDGLIDEVKLYNYGLTAEKIKEDYEGFCYSKTCLELNKECGSWDDGCGNQINCGSCPEGKACYNGTCVDIEHSLSVKTDSSSPLSDIIMGGYYAILGQFNISNNSDEALDLDKIQLNVLNSLAIDRLFFYDGNKLLESIYSSDDYVSVSFENNALTIPVNESKVITIAGIVKYTDNDIVKNGTSIQVSISKVEATKITSGRSVDSNDTASADLMYVYSTRPYLSKSADSPSGDFIPAKDTLLAVFNIANRGVAIGIEAGGKGDSIIFDKLLNSLITIDVEGRVRDTDYQPLSFTLKDENGQTLDSTEGNVHLAGGIVTGTITFNFEQNGIIIPDYEVRKIYVYGNMEQFEDEGDSIQLSLIDDSPNNISWGIIKGDSNYGPYNHADIIFRGGIQAGRLTKASAGPTKQPKIIGISPSEAKQGTMVDITIRGENFKGAGSLNGCGLSPLLDKDFKLELCGEISDTEMSARYIISADAKPEIKYISVTTPSGGKSNEMPFTILGSSLVSHYKFENNTQDSSGSNHGTASGNPEYTEGKSGKAIKLDGIDDYVKIPYHPSLYSDIMTISFWAKSNKSDYAINSYPISMWDYATNKRMWAVYIPASTDKWSIFTSSDGGYKLVSTRSTNTAIDTNWHKYDIVAVNINTSKAWHIYIDGAYSQTLTQYYSYTDKGSSLTIGGLIGSNYFDGLIDEVKLYNYGLTAEEIKNDYKSYNINIALNKPAASDYGKPESPKYAVDGNNSTWWSAEGYGDTSDTNTGKAHLYIDLMDEYWVSGYSIMCQGTNGGNSGTIYFYDSSGNTVLSRPYNSANSIPFSEKLPYEAKVRKITIEASSGRDWRHVNEIQVYGVKNVPTYGFIEKPNQTVELNNLENQFASIFTAVNEFIKRVKEFIFK